MSEDGVDKPYGETDKGSGADDEPEEMAPEDPGKEGRDVVSVEGAGGSDGKPFEADAETLPEASGGREEFFFGGAVEMREAAVEGFWQPVPAIELGGGGVGIRGFLGRFRGLRGSVFARVEAAVYVCIAPYHALRGCMRCE